MDSDHGFLNGGDGVPGRRQRPDRPPGAGLNMIGVSGVPALFVHEWLTKRLNLLWVVLATLGAVDLFLAFVNLGSDLLATVVNLVSGVVSVAAAVVIKGAWRPAGELLDRLSIGCMFVMWLTAVWTLVTAAMQISFVPEWIVMGPFYLVATVLAMIVTGTAAAAIKAMANQHTQTHPDDPPQGLNGDRNNDTRWSSRSIVLAVIAGLATLVVLPALYMNWQAHKAMDEVGDYLRDKQTDIESSQTSAAGDDAQRWSPILAMELPEQFVRVPNDKPDFEVWQYPFSIHDADGYNDYDSVVVRKIAKQFPGNGWPRCNGVPGTWSDGTHSISVEFFHDDDDVLMSVIFDRNTPCP
ncbi:MAG: hypothetical protein ACSLE6_18910 [Mycobacterium sp.]